MKSMNDECNDSVLVITFNLQQVLPTPILTSGIQFYKQKMLTYNFCIYNIKISKMYVWDEYPAKHGSCEITSCIIHYLTAVDEAIKKFVMFNDNCFG